MAWNDSTKILTAPFTKIAANGQGDLQKALKTTQMSEINIFKYGVWNKWAKYKYLKDPDVIRMTAARRVALNQGFACNDAYSDRTSFYHSSAEAAFLTARAMLSDGVVDWAYDRPTADTTDENMGQYYPLRPYDFLNDADIAQSGYNGNVGRPFAKVAFGQAANSPSGTWWFQFTFHYVPFGNVGGISLHELKAYKDKVDNGYTWYWGVLYKHNGGGSVSFAWLTTEAGGSTKIAVGTSETLYISGYIQIDQAVGANKLEAYLCAACKSATSDTPVGYIHLPIDDATCDITNPSAELHFYTNAYQDPRQTSPLPGFFITYVESSGMYAITNASVRILMAGIADFADGKSGTWNIYAAVHFIGANSTYKDIYTNYSLDCSNPPEVAYIDINNWGSTPLGAYALGDVQVYFEIKIGSEATFYVNPLTGNVCTTASAATVTLAQIYAKNNAYLLYLEYYNQQDGTYDPTPYPPAIS